MKFKTICFDIDNVICGTNSKKDYSKSKPIKKNIEVINKIYEKSYLLRNVENQDVVVDHIIPLTGYSVTLQQYSVCGLHVENNLRIISNTDNSSKNNNFDFIGIAGGAGNANSVLHGQVANDMLIKDFNCI